jgi:hypothetical protein
MFAKKLYMFSIGTIEVPTYSKLVSKANLSILKLVPSQLVESVCVWVVNLAIPPNIVKQHLPKTLFRLEVGEMIIDETCAQERIQDLTITGWIVIKEENR